MQTASDDPAMIPPASFDEDVWEEKDPRFEALVQKAEAWAKAQPDPIDP
jgi:hypothetical protein